MTEIRSRVLAGIFFVSSATLCLEIALTRYFSICQNYHFAFLVISIAFLGYGASGSLLSLFGRLSDEKVEGRLAASAFLFSLSILFSFLLSNALPFDLFTLAWDKKQLLWILAYYLVFGIPFFFAGLTISLAISRFAQTVTKVYFSDLSGAGLGSFLAAFIFLPRGEKGVFLIISSLALLASLLFTSSKARGFRLVILLFLAAEIAAILSPPSFLSFRISPYKTLPVALKYPQAKTWLTRWNSLSRVDAIASPAVRYAPGLSLLYEDSLPPQLGLSLDGGELCAITSFHGLQDRSLAFLSYLPSSLAYSLARKPRALIIEPKGGLDVLASSFFGASSITVVESNPLIPRILRRELKAASGGLYSQANIKLITSHPREALERDKSSYDLIVFSLTDVFGASSSGLYGLGENYLYTVESFARTFDLLSPDGIISMAFYLLPPARQEAKALATWVEVLEKRRKNPSGHIIALRSWGTISYFIKKNPFTAEDISRLKLFARERLFDLVYYPGIKPEETNIHNELQNPVYEELAQRLLAPRDRNQLYASSLFAIRPATDNRPFFFNFFRWKKIPETYRALGRRWLPFFQGEFLVPALLLQGVLIATLFIFLPALFLQRKLRSPGSSLFRVFFYFYLIGAGFILVEIMLVQRFVLFLGHSLYALSAIIFSLLFSSSLGSLASKRIFGQNLQKKTKLGLLLAAGLILAVLATQPLFSQKLIGLRLAWKIGLTFFYIFPLGFFMGFPFPGGVRLLESRAKGLIPWAWATNAFSSVIHSVFALLVAFWAGYNFVLGLAAGSYLLALLFLGFAHHGDKNNA